MGIMKFGFIRCPPALSDALVNYVVDAFETLVEIMPSDEKVNEVTTYLNIRTFEEDGDPDVERIMHRRYFLLLYGISTTKQAEESLGQRAASKDGTTVFSRFS